jgi:hypothetical protein
MAFLVLLPNRQRKDCAAIYCIVECCYRNDAGIVLLSIVDSIVVDVDVQYSTVSSGWMMLLLISIYR